MGPEADREPVKFQFGYLWYEILALAWISSRVYFLLSKGVKVKIA
tara:strand:+ start:460 stop:594 length:135 start_codon:yes stop_codon:yes gene_type:complete